MLAGLAPSLASGQPVVFEWGGYAGTATTLSVVTLTGLSIAAASDDRLVVAMVGARGSAGGARTITGIKIGGTTAPIHVASASSPNPTAIASRLIQAGTTAAVEITASAALSRCAVSLAVLRRLRSPDPTVASNIGTGASQSIARSVLGGGVGLFVLSKESVNATAWTGADKNNDASPDTVLRFSDASYLPDFDAGGFIAGASWSGAGANSMCGVAFR